MTVIASVEGVEARCLIDTGSNVEAISETFARKIIPKPIICRSLNSSLKIVDGISSIVLEIPKEISGNALKLRKLNGFSQSVPTVNLVFA